MSTRKSANPVSANHKLPVGGSCPTWLEAISRCFLSTTPHAYSTYIDLIHLLNVQNIRKIVSVFIYMGCIIGSLFYIIATLWQHVMWHDIHETFWWQRTVESSSNSAKKFKNNIGNDTKCLLVSFYPRPRAHQNRADPARPSKDQSRPRTPVQRKDGRDMKSRWRCSQIPSLEVEQPEVFTDTVCVWEVPRNTAADKLKPPSPSLSLKPPGLCH